MSLPETLHVRISSESADLISLTPVVAQSMDLEQLLRLILGVTGKDQERVRDILARGSLVAGASRLRWTGFEAGAGELARYLERFPDSDPSQRFEALRCFRAVLRGPLKPLIVEREAGKKKRLFRRRNFWDEMMALTAEPEYVEYSHRDGADIFRWRLDAERQRRLGEAGRLLAWSSYASQVQQGLVHTVDLYVRR